MRCLRNLRTTILFLGLFFGGLLLRPSDCRAEDGAPSIVTYGFDGFWTGAQVGLAAGYLATGDSYDSGEWRKLVFGAGIGALSGAGVGLALGIADRAGDPPATGWYIVRDAGYGTTLGALAGTVVGALVWAGDGRPKDMLTGASIGAIAGAGAGIIFGIIEGATSDDTPTAKGRAQPEVAFTLVGNPDSLLPVPGVSGRF